jgi:DNA-binding transcriptional MerR regulator
MRESQVELKAGQVAAVLGVSPKQIQSAVDAGYVRPSVPGRGRGSVRRYSFEDVVQMMVFDILVNAYGLDKQHAARMLSRAWPQPFTRRKKVLVIAPAAEAIDENIELEPIKLPLGEIISLAEQRIRRILSNYREKKRGRPQGWSRQMYQALAEVSEHLQGVRDNQIQKEMESYRAARRRRSEVAGR